MFIPSVTLIFKEKEWRLFWETKLMAKDTIETAHSNKETWWLHDAEKHREMKAKIMHREHLHNQWSEWSYKHEELKWSD